MKDIELFDQTFKVLVAVAASVWGIYAMLILFADDRTGCAADAFHWLFSVLIWTGGLTSALPLLYGLVRVLLWPTGIKKKKGIWVPALIIGWGVSIFIAVVITFAVAASQFGCR